MQHRVEDNSSDGKISSQIFQPSLQDDTIIKVKCGENNIIFQSKLYSMILFDKKTRRALGNFESKSQLEKKYLQRMFLPKLSQLSNNLN